MLPNFLGIGVPRAATTWLFNCLREHPEIFMPEQKELHFFDKHFENGITYYADYFAKGIGCKAAGEITPNYLACKLCPERISKLIPNAKMIVIFRNPIEMTSSFYRKFLYPATKVSFERTVEKEAWLLKWGHYWEHLDRYFKCFPRENFRIFLYEDVLNDGLGVVQDIFRFLGVNAAFVPKWIDKSTNISPLSDWEIIFDMAGLTRLKDFLRNSPIAEAARVIHKKRKQNIRVSVDEATRAILIEYFREPNNRLAKLIGRDLSAWME